ncbi:ABC transporter permease [Paenibacillus sp. 1P07SE]|uniref:ABC transporter permease n=1 Tax=Paenibacillus sp. 1P07SE TaxID=3132209 RepID=UPI0039A531AC
MKAYKQLTLAQLKLFARNRQMLFWSVAFPIFLMVMMGSFLGQGNNLSLQGILVDEDGSPASIELKERLLAAGALSLSEGDDTGGAMAALRGGETSLVIVLPAGLGAAIDADLPDGGGASPVRLYTDETQLTVSELARTAVTFIIDEVSKERTGYVPLLVVESEGIQSLELSYIDFLVPGIVAMMIMTTNLNGVAGQISSWRERGILRRMQSTPLHASSFIAAQITARLLLNGLQAVIVIAIAQLVFGTQVNGSWLLLLAFVVAGTLAFMSIGFIIAGVAKTPESAGPISGFVSFPLLFLGGVFFPIQNMPELLQPIVKLLPIAHLSTALRQIMNVGASLGDVWFEAALLGGWLIVAFAAATLTFKWE